MLGNGGGRVATGVAGDHHAAVQEGKMATRASFLSGGTLYGAACVWAVSSGQILTALGLVVVALLGLAIVALAHVLGPTPSGGPAVG